jgi:deoxyribodipyrimidine photo-lyase
MPLIDALMRELNTTGDITNRGREIVCSYLTRDLLIDWRYGAYHFEEKLIDFDVHANWANWQFMLNHDWSFDAIG